MNKRGEAKSAVYEKSRFIRISFGFFCTSIKMGCYGQARIKEWAILCFVSKSGFWNPQFFQNADIIAMDLKSNPTLPNIAPKQFFLPNKRDKIGFSKLSVNDTHFESSVIGMKNQHLSRPFEIQKNIRNTSRSVLYMKHAFGAWS